MLFFVVIIENGSHAERISRDKVIDDSTFNLLSDDQDCVLSAELLVQLLEIVT